MPEAISVVFTKRRSQPCLNAGVFFRPIADIRVGGKKGVGWEFRMKHYRVNKLTKPAGLVVKTKDILATDDRDAMKSAREDADCPVCEVLQAGKKIGAIT